MVNNIQTAKPQLSLKKIFLKDHNWYYFHEKYAQKLRAVIVKEVIKFLSCKNRVRGSLKYECSNLICTHVKYLHFTCKSRLCSSCGKKSTLQWQEDLAKQFPDVPYQHITFTMPSELWGLFWLNRSLFKMIAPAAVNCIKKVISKLNIKPGIFLAIHTFGADLKRNVHIHLLLTLGGISNNYQQWKSMPALVNKQLVPLWRKAIIQQLRRQYNKGKLKLGHKFSYLNGSYTEFNRFLNKHYKTWWHVHCDKPEKNATAIRNYLARYVRRPPIANARLQHCTQTSVGFYFKNRKTKKTELKVMSPFEFIAKVIQHIPDTGFRLIRYYGFLSNRLRGTCLPIVRKLLQLPEPTSANKTITYATMIQQFLNLNPFTCIVCGNEMILRHIKPRYANSQLKQFHRQLALNKPCF